MAYKDKEKKAIWFQNYKIAHREQAKRYMAQYYRDNEVLLREAADYLLGHKPRI